MDISHSAEDALFCSALETPYGWMCLAVDGDGVLVEVWLPNRRPPREPEHEILPRSAAGGLRDARVQLHEYFAGKRRAFELLLAPRGSQFERDVWTQLQAIPYGLTTSYGAIALEMGLVNAARAVGRANGANPIPIVIPCHRVIGSDGKLTGYGGGLPLKRALLELEGAIAQPDLRLF